MQTILIIIIVISAISACFYAGIKVSLTGCDRIVFDIDIKNGTIKQGIVFRPADNIELCITCMRTGEILSLCIYASSSLILCGCQNFDIVGKLIFLSCAICIATIFCKALPTALFYKNANQALRKLVPIADFVSNFLYPLVYLVMFQVISATGKIKGKKSDLKQNNISELIPTITSKFEDEEYSTEKLQILKKALDFTNITIRECLVPRNEIVSVNINDTINSLTNKFVESEYSKILICNGSLDRIVGYVNALDLFKQPKDIKSVLIPVIEVPETMTADKLLKQFIKKRRSVAVVTDEYGGTVGMITVEDIIEEITGEIEDEHDIQELVERQTNNSEYIFSGRLEIDYINEKYKIHIPKRDDYETLAGYILYLNKDFPKNGDEFVDGPIKTKVLQVKKPKINTIKLTIIK
ncbi:MAG: CBS domain-containing protein [Bacteroidales bacterium]|nr:CBS domain-containing protein [Bacteroidales bacterium]